MAVQWGLQGEGFNALEVLQSFGQAANQRRVQDAQVRQQQVGSMAAQGDLQGARTAALQGGDFDTAAHLGKLTDQQRTQAATEARTLAAAATRLRSLPVEQRAQALQSFAPVLRASGFDEQEITGADLSDGGLDNYINVGKAFLDNTDKQDEPSIIRTLQAVGIDPRSAEGRDIVTRSLSAPRYLPNGDGTFTVVGGTGQTPQQQSSTAVPTPGTVEDGYRFRGGDPANPASWEPVGGASPQGGATFP